MLDIRFCDLNKELCEAFEEEVTEWKTGKEYFPHAELSISVHNKSILEDKVDAVVAPGNSFGIMNGGLDLVLRNYFGMQVQRDIQDHFLNKKQPEILVGQVAIVMTKDKYIPWIIYSSTMRVPQKIEDTVDVMLSTRAAVGSAIFNCIDSVAIAGMGALAGQVPSEECARRMVQGIQLALTGPQPLPENDPWRDINV